MDNDSIERGMCILQFQYVLSTACFNYRTVDRAVRYTYLSPIMVRGYLRQKLR